MTGKTETSQAVMPGRVMSSASEFALVLPPQMTPEYFARLSVGLLRQNPTLADAAERNQAGFLNALLECARLGLTPGTNEVALVPRKNEIVCQPQWQGVVKRMLNTGRVQAVIAEAVFANDTFTYQPGDKTPRHEVDWFADRGELVGAYAYALLTGGGVSKVAVVGPREIARAKASAQGVNRSDSPWNTDTPEMARKTAVHRLADWVPQSAADHTVTHPPTAAAAPVTVTLPTTPPPAAVPGPAIVDTTHLPNPPAIPLAADETTGEILDAEVMEPGEE